MSGQNLYIYLLAMAELARMESFKTWNAQRAMQGETPDYGADAFDGICEELTRLASSVER